MASHGARASGGDGGDFTHRERVAVHYKQSSVYKQRQSLLSVGHGGFVLVVAANVAVECMHSGTMPLSTIVQCVFVLSIVATLLARTAQHRNLSTRITVALMAHLLTAVLPLVVYSAVQHSGMPITHIVFISCALLVDVSMAWLMWRLANCWEVVGQDGRKRR